MIREMLFDYTFNDFVGNFIIYALYLFTVPLAVGSSFLKWRESLLPVLSIMLVARRRNERISGIIFVFSLICDFISFLF